MTTTPKQIARQMLVGDADIPGYDAAAVDAELAKIDEAQFVAAERAKITTADGWVYYNGIRTHQQGADTLDDLANRAAARRIAETVGAALSVAQ